MKKEAVKIQRQKHYNKNTAHVVCKNKSDTSNNRGNWNHFKIIQTIPEQQTGIKQNQEITENSHIWHCTHTVGSAEVKA
jgi:hypothetical protein